MTATTDPMKRLVLDIETSPISAKVWGLRDQFISLNQIDEPTQMLSFAAKWYGDSKTKFYAGYQGDTPGFTPEVREHMVRAAWDLVNEAEVIIHFNGKSFDMKHLNREFMEFRLGPPSPYQYIDLLAVAKANFRLPSYKLEYILRWLGHEGKIQHQGFDLWNLVMDGDLKARRLFKRYNVGDVVKTEVVYDEVKAWISNHPVMSLFTGADIDDVRCPVCDSTDVRLEGTTARGRLARVQRYQCKQCGKWFQGKKAISQAEER